MKRVVVLGGGISGMSAAHELVERGFDVHVYEMKSIPGGKARSIPVPNSGTDGRKDLPGEHGFRFFPRFYKHVTDTMKRIPYKNNPQGVFDNLVDTTRIELARKDGTPVAVVSRFPRSLEDLEVIFKDISSTQSLGLTESDIAFFAERIWQLLTSCSERKLEEYEKLGWWNYLEADKHSAAYRSLLAKGLTRSLVASKAELASTRTVGSIFLQLMFDILDPGVSSDRVLNGPTSDVWLNPWLQHLVSSGVQYHMDTQITAINCTNGEIQSITIEREVDGKKKEQQVWGDYYISALPIEVFSGLLDSELLKADPNFANIQRLSLSTAWMNGIQFYLKNDVEITHGHVLYVDSPWALTSISQRQFWSNTHLSDYGNGTIKGILSVCVSDWGFYIDPTTQLAGVTDSEGELFGKRAIDCTPEQIKEEVWYQLKQSLNVDGNVLLKDEDLETWFIDSDIESPSQENFERLLDIALSKSLKKLFLCMQKLEGDKGFSTLAEITDAMQQDEATVRTSVDMLINKGFVRNALDTGEPHYETCLDVPDEINLEPLLVNLINTWHLRPDAATRIPNLFLAGDYVRTNTDLATMEGANEAARRAVNCIIDASGVKAPYCKLWELKEPEVFALWRFHDSIRYKQGLPWSEKLPFPLQLLQSLYSLLTLGKAKTLS